MTDQFIPGLLLEADYGQYRLKARTGSFCRFDTSNMTNHQHWHDCHEICIVLEGNGAFIHGTERYELETGDLFVADPQVMHEINSFATRDLLLYFFSLRIEDRQLPSFGLREEQALENFLATHRIMVKRCFHLNRYVEFLESYHHRCREHGFWSRRLMENFFFESLESLATTKIVELHAQQQTDSSLLETAIGFIQNNLHRKITLEDIAAHCCTCERNLQLQFRQHLQTTPVHFMNEKKAVTAAGYLLQGHRVAEAGGVIGIRDPGQFSRFFKKYFHCSPKAYQQRYLPGGMKFSARHLGTTEK